MSNYFNSGLLAIILCLKFKPVPKTRTAQALRCTLISMGKKTIARIDLLGNHNQLHKISPFHREQGIYFFWVFKDEILDMPSMGLRLASLGVARLSQGYALINFSASSKVYFQSLGQSFYFNY